MSSCDKEHDDDPIIPHAKLRTIVYEVSGTNFRLNYIDSTSAFKKDEVHKGFFRYEFRKGSGASIGISIFRQSIADTIYNWNIYIDNKLYANALSEGGAYFTIPYE